MHSQCLTLITIIAIGSMGLTAQDRTAGRFVEQGGAAQPEPSRDGTVTGFVRYASGGAIPDVRVSLIVPGDPVARTTRTRVDGSYRFDAIPAGEYQVSASHAGAVGRRIKIAPGSELRSIDFSIADGGARRVVTGRVVMNDASRSQQIPARIGIGIVVRKDRTLVLPLPPGDHRVNVRLPSGYFLDSATLGSETLYSMDSDGRRLSAAAFSITVPPEPVTSPELVITLGYSR